MQNREELRQKREDTMESNNDVSQEGEKYHFRKGAGIDFVPRPKYRPLEAID
jgi:hypothetical protein